ncbi:F0F1 ATP synthase subunit A [Clostridium sp.]|uniref:F0F1 ATP synthase subunit A n=1 Tax=Clostridium sp. TaxID=1506 RepID=UPI002FDC9C99
MEEFSPLFSIHIGTFKFGITSSVVIQWVIILILAVLAKIFTRNMRRLPDKRQNVIEMIVEAVQNLVKDNMGKEYISFVPYVGTLAIYILVMNIAPVIIGLKAPTEDLSVAVGLALITFVLVQFNAIKRTGLKSYFLGYAKPNVVLVPLNIVERIVLPVSLSLRLFGNLTAGAVIIGMVYKGLGNIAWFSQLLIPIPLHAFFDLFDGSIQMLVFVMLTIMNIKVIAEH